jgi:plasmid stabilization system protein ParE
VTNDETNPEAVEWERQATEHIDSIVNHPGRIECYFERFARLLDTFKAWRQNRPPMARVPHDLTRVVPYVSAWLYIQHQGYEIVDGKLVPDRDRARYIASQLREVMTFAAYHGRQDLVNKLERVIKDGGFDR